MEINNKQIYRKLTSDLHIRPSVIDALFCDIGWYGDYIIKNNILYFNDGLGNYTRHRKFKLPERDYPELLAKFKKELAQPKFINKQLNKDVSSSWLMYQPHPFTMERLNHVNKNDPDYSEEKLIDVMVKRNYVTIQKDGSWKPRALRITKGTDYLMFVQRDDQYMFDGMMFKQMYKILKELE